MHQPTSRILFDYWDDVRADRRAPTRFDIEPARIASILSETFILESAADHSFPFRLAGTRICERFGCELRGTDFLDLTGDDRAIVRAQLDRVTDEGAIAVLELEAETGDGRGVVFEVVIMPLLHPGNSVTRYLGAISAIDAPYWLGVEPLHAVGVLSHQLVWPEGRGEHEEHEERIEVDLDERQSPFSPELAAGRIVRFDRRQFRILDGGRKD